MAANAGRGRLVKIAQLRIRRLQGVMETDGAFWEERLVRPIDIYPEYRKQSIWEGGEQIDRQHLRLIADFLEIHADEGVVGTAGPVWPDASHLILTQLAPIVMGKDPLAIELLWDQMHRLQVHGRQGHMMIAISAVDCALWDLKGKAFGQPIWRILGGATRDSVPAYASMLGYAVEDLGRVKERALACKASGYAAQNGSFDMARRVATRGCERTSRSSRRCGRRWATTTTS
jgi:L-rhamnonate dehydratase